jgi:hypothetical protein
MTKKPFALPCLAMDLDANLDRIPTKKMKKTTMPWAADTAWYVVRVFIDRSIF